MKKEQKVKGVKAFNPDLTCRGFQYEIGKTYETDKKPIRCTENGFHFCEYPLDVLGYYKPTDRFAEVVGSGQVDGDNADSKVAASKLHIETEIKLSQLAQLAVKFILDRVKVTKKGSATENNSAATNTGYGSAATNTWYRSAATNTGYGSAAEVTGKESVACGLGYDNKSRGEIGNWLVLAERNTNYDIISVKSVKVDGKKIEPMVWYKLHNGRFIKSE